MARLRVIVLAAAGLLAAGPAGAQAVYSGLLSGHLGAASGGDVEGAGLTTGAALAVLDPRGLGAELDLAHTRSFDNDRFSESGITSLVIGVLWARPHPAVRPFGGAGVGLLRVRADAAGTRVVNRTDWGFSAGGGLLYMLDDAFGVRGEVRYFRYFQRHDDVPLRDAGFFDYWRTSIGVTYVWPMW